MKAACNDDLRWSRPGGRAIYNHANLVNVLNLVISVNLVHLLDLVNLVNIVSPVNLLGSSEPYVNLANHVNLVNHVNFHLVAALIHLPPSRSPPLCCGRSGAEDGVKAS